MNRPLNILVVEDEYITQKTISVYLKEMGYNVIGTAMNALDAIKILENNKVEFALLDITINGEKDGIWLANYIKENYNIPHVFLTAYADDVTINNAIATNPYGYLIKPFQKAELYSSIEIAIMNFNQKIQTTEENQNDFMFIKHEDVYERIMLDSIQYIECQKNYLILICPQNEYRIRATISDFLTKLPNSFIKTHKGFIVNSTKIESFNPNFVCIEDKKIPISKTYKENVFKVLNYSSGR